VHNSLEVNEDRVKAETEGVTASGECRDFIGEARAYGRDLLILSIITIIIIIM